METAKRKCIHVVKTDGYAPQMCAITMPRIHKYAERIGADINIIRQQQYPTYPINYERLQIYEVGKNYEWNFNIDADMLIGDSLYDPTEFLPKHCVGVTMGFDARGCIDLSDPAFVADGRGLGIVDAFVVTSQITHELWRPLDGEFGQYVHLFKDGNTRRISEYAISLNLARHRYPIQGLFIKGQQIFHINYTSEKKDDAVALALNKLAQWSTGGL